MSGHACSSSNESHVRFSQPVFKRELTLIWDALHSVCIYEPLGVLPSLQEQFNCIGAVKLIAGKNWLFSVKLLVREGRKSYRHIV